MNDTRHKPFSIIDTQRNNTISNGIMLNVIVIMLCHDLYFGMLNVVMMSVLMMNVVSPSTVILTSTFNTIASSIKTVNYKHLQLYLGNSYTIWTILISLRKYQTNLSTNLRCICMHDFKMRFDLKNVSVNCCSVRFQEPRQWHKKRYAELRTLIRVKNSAKITFTFYQAGWG
jgi:hypothetical protein